MRRGGAVVRSRSHRARQEGRQIRIYVAECYWPGVSAEGLAAVAARATRGAEEARLAGRSVRYLTSLLFERDDVLFSLFLAHSQDDVRDAALRGEITVDRISESLTDLTLSSAPGPPEIVVP